MRFQDIPILVGGWALPLWKMMDWKSVGMMNFPIYGNVKIIFQTTNQRSISGVRTGIDPGWAEGLAGALNYGTVSKFGTMTPRRLMGWWHPKNGIPTTLVPWDPLGPEQCRFRLLPATPRCSPKRHLSAQYHSSQNSSKLQGGIPLPHDIYGNQPSKVCHSNLSFSSFTIPFHCYNEIWSIACNNACKEGHCHQGLTQNTRCQRQHHRKPSGQSIQFYTTTSTPLSETIQQVVKRTIILSNNEGKPIWSAGSVWHFETLVWRQCPSHQHSIQSNTAS